MLRPNEQRAKTAITLLWIVLALEIASLISACLQYNLIQTVANGGDISSEAADANDLRQQAIAIMYTLAYIGCAITFIAWFRRAYFNLNQKLYLSQTDGWAAGSWFVPILNLFRPYQMMKELYVETRELLLQKNCSPVNLGTTLLGWWWTLWIVSNFLGRFVFRYSMSAETVDEILTSTMANITSNIIGIPLALLAIRVIKNYAAVEPLLYQMEEEEQPEGNVHIIEQPEQADTYQV